MNCLNSEKDYWLIKKILDSTWYISKNENLLERRYVNIKQKIIFVAEKFKLFSNFYIKMRFLKFTCGTIKEKLGLVRLGSQKKI